MITHTPFRTQRASIITWRELKGVVCRAATMISIVLLTFALWQCAPGAHPIPEAEAPAASAALRGLAIDSMCVGRCTAVQIDESVRRTPTLLAYYPFDAPTIGRLDPALWDTLQGKPVKLISGWPQPDPTADTLRLTVYRVEGGKHDAGERVYGIAVLPPGGVLRTWAVEVGETDGTWYVARKWLFFEP